MGKVDQLRELYVCIQHLCIYQANLFNLPRCSPYMIFKKKYVHTNLREKHETQNN